MSYIFQEIVRLHFYYESLSMNQSSCIKKLVVWLAFMRNWNRNYLTENYSDEAYASIMDEEVSVFNYLQWVYWIDE